MVAGDDSGLWCASVCIRPEGARFAGDDSWPVGGAAAADDDALVDWKHVCPRPRETQLAGDESWPVPAGVWSKPRRASAASNAPALVSLAMANGDGTRSGRG